MQAQVDVIAPVLSNLGIDAQKGHLGWFNTKPIQLAVMGYNVFHPEEIVDDKVSDFVMHTTVQWDSTSGLAGCGILFRSEDNFDIGGRYEFDLLRVQFAPAWGIFYVKYGRIEQNLTNFVPSSYIKDEKDSINTVDLVVQGKQMTPYINGEKMRVVENDKLTEGKIYLIAHQESGNTLCTFKDGWVWILDE